MCLESCIAYTLYVEQWSIPVLETQFTMGPDYGCTNYYLRLQDSLQIGLYPIIQVNKYLSYQVPCKFLVVGTSTIMRLIDYINYD